MPNHERWVANLEKSRECSRKSVAKWRKDNPEKHRLVRAAAQKKYHDDHPNYSMFRNARVRAKRLGIPFNLTLSDIKIPERCPVLGIPLFRGTKTVGANSPSLDRLQPELGYVRGNVWVISQKANSIKQDATPDEIAAVAEAVRRKILLGDL